MHNWAHSICSICQVLTCTHRLHLCRHHLRSQFAAPFNYTFLRRRVVSSAAVVFTNLLSLYHGKLDGRGPISFPFLLCHARRSRRNLLKSFDVAKERWSTTNDATLHPIERIQTDLLLLLTVQTTTDRRNIQQFVKGFVYCWVFKFMIQFNV